MCGVGGQPVARSQRLEGQRQGECGDGGRRQPAERAVQWSASPKGGPDLVPTKNPGLSYHSQRLGLALAVRQINQVDLGSRGNLVQTLVLDSRDLDALAGG